MLDLVIADGDSDFKASAVVLRFSGSGRKSHSNQLPAYSLRISLPDVRLVCQFVIFLRYWSEIICQTTQLGSGPSGTAGLGQMLWPAYPWAQ